MKNNVIERSCIRSYVDDDKLQSLQEEINSNIDFELDAELFAMLASPTRLKIIYCLLKSDELCVCDFADIMDMTVSAIYSQTYDIGDVVSLENQMSAYEVCYGDYPNDSLKLADFNGGLNGGNYVITFIAI